MDYCFSRFVFGQFNRTRHLQELQDPSRTFKEIIKNFKIVVKKFNKLKIIVGSLKIHKLPTSFTKIQI